MKKALWLLLVILMLAVVTGAPTSVGAAADFEITDLMTGPRSVQENDQVRATDDVRLEADKSQTVSFTLCRDTAGHHMVELDGSTDIFTATPPLDILYLVVPIVIGFGIGAAVGWYLQRRQLLTEPGAWYIPSRRRSLITISAPLLLAGVGFIGIYYGFSQTGIAWPSSIPATGTPPVIQSVSVSSVAETSAVITWTTDEPATSQVEYGYTADYGLTVPLDENLVTSHSVSLTGLEPDRTYCFRVRSKDEGGNEAISEAELRTLADTTPPLLSAVKVSKYTGETAVITWVTDEGATSRVDYGTTDVYGKSTALDEELTTSHSVKLAGLEPNTGYHFRVKSQDNSGNEAVSRDKAFTTWAPDKNWAEYVNEEYDFSVWYPAKWAAQAATAESLVFYAAAPFQVPVLLVFVGEGTTFTDALTTSMQNAGGTNIAIEPESETALADGSLAFQTTLTVRLRGFPAVAFALGAQNDDKWILVIVGTVEMLAKFDEALFSQIAHSLQFAEPAAGPEQEAGEEVAEEEAGGLSFKAAEYVNEEYHFAVSYPQRWIQDRLYGSDVFRVKEADGTPVLAVAIWYGWPTTLTNMAQGQVGWFRQHGYTDIKVVSQNETTLADGTTPAYEIVIDFTSEDGWRGRSLYLEVSKGDKWIALIATEGQDWYPAMEPLLREIIYSLRFE